MRRLRELVRDRRARDQARRFVLEGPRVVSGALDRGAHLLECYLGPEAGPHARAVAERAGALGVPLWRLGPGVAERVGDTRTPQGVFAVAPLRRSTLAELGDADLVLVGVHLSDPGNVGTLVRSAEAAGAGGVLLGAGSVDAYTPKVVRASAGAILGVPVVEGLEAVAILEALGERGLVRLGAVATGGVAPEQVDLRRPTAVVLGHEAHGLGPDLPLDGFLSIPMAGHAESLNVAMAGTVVLFEAARQRRGGRGGAP